MSTQRRRGLQGPGPEMRPTVDKFPALLSQMNQNVTSMSVGKGAKASALGTAERWPISCARLFDPAHLTKEELDELMRAATWPD